MMPCLIEAFLTWSLYTRFGKGIAIILGSTFSRLKEFYQHIELCINKLAEEQDVGQNEKADAASIITSPQMLAYYFSALSPDISNI